MRMISGRAVDGPCDGARLAALPSWDGRVELPRKSDKTPRMFHPGHYQWDWDFGVWIWHKDKLVKLKEKAGTPRR